MTTGLLAPALDLQTWSPRPTNASVAVPLLRVAQATVHLNRAAARFLGLPSEVAYLVEPADRLLAVVALEPGRPGGYSLRQHSANTWLASARALIKSHGLPIAAPWRPTFEYEAAGGGACLVAHFPDWNPRG